MKVFEDTKDKMEEIKYEVNNKSKIWTENEVKKMLSIIKEFNLTQELSLSSFSLPALHRVSEMMRCNGFYRPLDEVRTVLNCFKKAYIKSRDNSCIDKEKLCPYYNCLDELWGSMTETFNSPEKKESPVVKSETSFQKRERGEFWSEEETIVLLTCIKELDVVDEAFRTTEYATTKLSEALKDSGYMRTNSQIRNKLKNLKSNFINERRSNCMEVAIKKFPFYHLYESIFGDNFSSINDGSMPAASEENEKMQEETYHLVPENESDKSMERKKHNRSPAWSEEETILLFALIHEMHLAEEIRERLTLDVALKLVKPIEEHGFIRTAEQIKTKLKNLRSAYHRCIQLGVTPSALADCPHFNRLHVVFERIIPGKKVEIVRKLQPVDDDYMSIIEPSVDHSYVNVQSVDEIEKLDSSTRLERSKSRDLDKEEWCPVETILDDECSSSSVNEKDEIRDEGVDDEEQDIQQVEFEEVDDGDEIYLCKDSESLNDETFEPVEKDQSLFDEPLENMKLQKIQKVESTVNYESVNDSQSLYKEESCNLPSRNEIRQIERSRSDSSSRAAKTSRQLHNSFDPYPAQSNSVLMQTKTVRSIMTDVLKHEKWLQEQHQTWMEKQFEIQRKHDREQRELFLNELKELRHAITSTMFRREFFQDQ
ncbi:uncharacterized protein LOC111673998 isoform X2 [Orussus abietinus]|nr:uncharacterized protein LOC111673998 isoform X2 [Orussus abietinus]